MWLIARLFDDYFAQKLYEILIDLSWTNMSLHIEHYQHVILKAVGHRTLAACTVFLIKIMTACLVRMHTHI